MIQAKKITVGLSRSGDLCPVAIAVVEMGFGDVHVSEDVLMVSKCNERDEEVRLAYQLPKSAKDFIECFDNDVPVRPFHFYVDERLKAVVPVHTGKDPQ